MVERNYLVKRKGRTLAREFTREKAKSRKKQLQRAGVQFLSVVKKKSTKKLINLRAGDKLTKKEKREFAIQLAQLQY